MSPIKHKFFRRKFQLLTGISMMATMLLSGSAFSQTAISFDINRYTTSGEGRFETFYPEETTSLQAALDNNLLAEETLMLVTETAAGKLALIRDQMAFHHIVMGKANGKDWMATF